jgi:hypothetical protein
MAPEQKKRSRPVPNKSQRSKKRQKIEPTKNGDTVQKPRVAVDALPWNEVEMPEMFDDAEGFYGLEEVEGVEIIRDGDTVQFVGFLWPAPIIKTKTQLFVRCLLQYKDRNMTKTMNLKALGVMM